jgi:hypothetical protein
MALVMDDSAKEGLRQYDPKPQVFIGGTSDFEPDTGAKMIHKYVHELKANKEGPSADKSGAKAAASVQVDDRERLPNHVIFAMPQSSSLRPGFYGYKPQLETEDEEYDSASGDELANVIVSTAAAGKEGADKIKPVLVDGDHDDGRMAGPSSSNKILPLPQMREGTRAYLDDYRRPPNPNIIGRITLSVVGEILGTTILDPSRGLSTISRESSRFAALSDAGRQNICWELLEDIIPRGEVFKTVRVPDNHFSYTGFYARPSLMWRERAGEIPRLAPGDIESIHDACLFMEPTCDISIMVGSSKELLSELKNTIPARVRGQRMEVLWSGLPPIYRSQDWQLWLRNTMAEDHPGAGPNPSQYMGTRLQAYEGSVEDIMEERGCTWFPTYTDATEGGPPTGVFLHIYDDGDEEVYRDIIHIAIGSFMIHLV